MANESTEKCICGCAERKCPQKKKKKKKNHLTLPSTTSTMLSLGPAATSRRPPKHAFQDVMRHGEGASERARPPSRACTKAEQSMCTDTGTDG
mmetsp:Transcript_9360/g.18479  ORF Transcript_9360/g.18479 Transcript_9360/m.18479 type:complete len:93 (-) Transcript_9360:1202-1480(-)